MRKKMFLMTFVLMFGLVSSATAADTIFWTNGTGNQNWTDIGNWDVRVPDWDAKATFDPGLAGAIINVGDAALAERVALGHKVAGVAADLTMNGGTLDVEKEFYIGGDDSSQLNVTGIFNMHGGTVTVGPGSDKFFVGYYGTGVLYMTGGLIEVGGSGRVYIAGEKPNSTGTVVMEGGTIIAHSRVRVGNKGGSSAYLYMHDGVIETPMFQIDNGDADIAVVKLYGGVIRTGAFEMGPNGSLDLEMGNLVIDGDVTAAVGAYGGQITAYGGIGNVSIAYHAGYDKTIVSGCLPEPATMTLLALGGLALLRRRK